MEKIEHRAVIKFITKPGKSVQIIMEEMSSVYRDSCPGRRISEGILLVDYKDKGVSITGEYYAIILERLKEAIKEKRRGKLTRGVLLLHNNAPPPQDPYCTGCPA